MKKISLALFVASMLFVSCSNDDTTPVDTGNDQGQNDDDNQSKGSIVGKWTAKDIKISGDHTVVIENIPIKGEFNGAATKATVSNVTYEFNENPQVVVTGGVFDAEIAVSAPGVSQDFNLEDQIFGNAGTWVLSDDGKQVTIKDAATSKDVVMDILELTTTSLKLKGQITTKVKLPDPVGEIEPTLDIEAEFTK